MNSVASNLLSTSLLRTSAVRRSKSSRSLTIPSGPSTRLTKCAYPRITIGLERMQGLPDRRGELLKAITFANDSKEEEDLRRKLR